MILSKCRFAEERNDQVVVKFLFCDKVIYIILETDHGRESPLGSARRAYASINQREQDGTG